LAALPADAAARNLIRPRARSPILTPLRKPLALRAALFALRPDQIDYKPAPPAGGGTPGGADLQVQFNSAGAFGGDPGLTYNAGTDTLSAGSVALGGFTSTLTSSANGAFRFSGTSTTLSGVAGTADHSLFVLGVDVSTAAAAGSVFVRGGAAGGTSNDAGDVEVRGGASSVSGVAGGSASLFGGSTSGSADTGGSVSIAGGAGSALGGSVFINRGSGGASVTVINGAGQGVANSFVFDSTGSIVVEGATADADEFTLAIGDPTADVTATITATATNTSFDLSGGHWNFPDRLTIGEYLDENDANESTLLIRKTTGYVAIHGSGGASDMFTAIGTRNDLEADGSGVSQSGIGMLAYGSAIGGTLYGQSRNNLVALLSEGPQNTGLVIGTGGQGGTGPVTIGTEDANGEYPKAFFYHGAKALTDGSAVEFVEIGIPSNSVTGGTIDYFFYAVSVSGLQSVSGTLWFTAVNLAGTETCTVGNTAGVDLIGIAAVSSGTLSGSFACVVGLTDVIRISLNANTSFASTAIFEVRWTGYKLAGFGKFTPL
jgi:hypothetical protein